MTKLIDYEQFCGSSATDKDGEVVLLPSDQRITARKLAEVADRISSLHRKLNLQPDFQVMEGSSPYLLVDVRPEVEVEMCAIQYSINLPLERLKEGKEEDVALLQREGKGRPIYMICRFNELHAS